MGIQDFTKKQCGIWDLTAPAWEAGFAEIGHGMRDGHMKKKVGFGIPKKKGVVRNSFFVCINLPLAATSHETFIFVISFASRDKMICEDFILSESHLLLQ